jgi:hypothetical protein
VRAERGAYFICSDVPLAPSQARTWFTVAEVNQGASEVVSLIDRLRDPVALVSALRNDMQKGSEDLFRLVAAADGMQRTGDELSCARHLSNVLFNVMRGGTFASGYAVDRDDFLEFIQEWNHPIFERNRSMLESLPEIVDFQGLRDRVREHGDRQLERLLNEYLPLSFSRRHGDPSRPWNRFSIETREPDGSRKLHFEGNWRDIFQNWEALALSFPAFTESMLSKFVNASTPDGHNPYRISRHGIDWEVVDPNDPWSNIGYWGDHQLIYLLKLMEISRRQHPGMLRGLLQRRLFGYANVPYRIKPYQSLLDNPYDTIEYDDLSASRIADRVASIGSDGRLVVGDSGEVHLVTLMEKLLVSVLAKLANFVVEAGIWMNTQRPEWNDANNALVGRGVSVVTLCHLRRYLAFCLELLDDEEAEFSLSVEVADWLRSADAAIQAVVTHLDRPLSEIDRKHLLDALGTAAENYRTALYESGFSGQSGEIDGSQIRDFVAASLALTDHSVRANQREDSLFHAYNLMAQTEAGIAIDRMYEMLEGQVAVLNSGILSAEETVEVLDALRASALFREDQHSYMLYPDRQLPRFTDKNNIAESVVAESSLLQRLVSDGDDSIVNRDVRGGFHFNGAFRNSHDLELALDRLKTAGYEHEVQREGARIVSVFEELFDHKSYTGRSGTFYGYEGLGSIYWHMVSKLLLAVAEAFQQAHSAGEDQEILKRLSDHYYQIRYGIGTTKNPADYGAIPTDPYSHTPGTAGAQQPGMTGQVKEDIIARWAELGVVVENGMLRFETALLRKDEFFHDPQTFEYVDVGGLSKTLELPAGALAFTYCQVPILYHLSDREGVSVEMTDGARQETDTLTLGREISSELMARSGRIHWIRVSIATLN